MATPTFHGGKPAEDCPDGPRYKGPRKQLGVPVVRWIGERIEDQLNRARRMAKAFDYIQVPLAVVATDLTGVSVEVEGLPGRARLLP